MSKTYNVLIVVDVQNCFIQGGSMGGDNKEKYEKQAQGIAKQVKTGKYNLVVFTRDFHPEYHISLYPVADPVNGVFPPHCRNSKRECTNLYNLNNEQYIKTGTTKAQYKKIKDVITKIQNYELYLEKIIIGTDLSYLFYNTSLAGSIEKLNEDNKRNHTIGLLKDYKEHPLINNIKWSDDISPIKFNEKTNIIALTKGEYCNYESYSAFNYHVKIDHVKINNGKPMNTLTDLEAHQNNSTGLWEYILYQLENNNDFAKINIDVCGLVTNICVINTVQQGIAMWEKVYKNHSLNKFTISKNGDFDFKISEVNFNLLDDLSIPLAINIPDVPFLNFNYDIPIESNTDDKQNMQRLDTIKLFEAKWLHDICIKNQSNLSGKFNLISNGITSTIILKPPPQQGGFHSTNCNCQSCNNMYKSKYLKYKQKYMELKNIEINNLNNYIQ